LTELRNHIRGVMCATVTPILEDGFTVDWAGIGQNAAWLVDSGVRVLVVNGSIGEPGLLSRSDRRRVVSETVGAVDGRAIVVAGCSDSSPAAVIELCEAAKHDGAAAVMVLPPHAFRPTESEILDFFAYLAGASPLPFLVYNNPSVTGFEIPLSAFSHLAGMSGFLGLKEASPNMARYHDLHERFGSSFPVVAANESFLFTSLAIGASGCMTAAAAFAPSVLAEIFDSFERLRLDEARRWFERLNGFRRLFRDDLAHGFAAYLPYTKAAMNLVGLAGGRPHFPTRPLDPARMEELRAVLERDLGLEIHQGEQ
jgi:4-hydroxy-tetrahydrodipicolinate synthase